MKILILTNSIVGAYKFRKELFYKLNKLGHNVFISSPNDTLNNYKEEFQKKNIKIIDTYIDRRGINVVKDLKLIFDYIKIIRDIKPDYILLYTIKPTIYGGIISRIFKIKYIVNITGLGSSLQNDKLLCKLLKKMYKFSLFKAKKVFFQNIANMNFFIENKILNDKNINLIPGSGVNLDKFTFLKKLENSKKIKFLFIGRIMKEKGIDELIEVFDKLNLETNQIELNILGQFEEEVYKEILKGKSFINYLGVTSDIREYVRNMDCIVNPSWHEGMSNVLLEAGAMKKFLIASEIPGCKEIVLNNITGFTFKVKRENALKESVYKYLSLKEDEKEKMIEKQYKHIKNNFSREKVINEYLKIINEGS